MPVYQAQALFLAFGLILQRVCSQIWRLSLAKAAAAAAKSLQLYQTLCDPIDGSPPGSPIPGILQARALEWVAISFSNAWEWKVKVKLLSCVWPLATRWTAAYQAPLSMGFSRQTSPILFDILQLSVGIIPSQNSFLFWFCYFLWFLFTSPILPLQNLWKILLFSLSYHLWIL